MEFAQDSDNTLSASLHGERFSVSYLLRGPEDEARAMATDICFEQTVEFPGDLVPVGPIREDIVGHIEAFEPAGSNRFRATISYAVETVQEDLVQFLNVVYGNISIKPGIRVEHFELPESITSKYRGPRFGRAGLRSLLGQAERPLSCTALKPMGLSPRELAEQAYQFALGGIDIVKDDHGIADQVFCPFEERVERCVQAVAAANAKTGFRSIYMPNVTARMDRMQSLARRAKELGAGALLLCPALTGIDALRVLADDDDIGLPLMAHPSFGGTLVTSKESGMEHGALYGTLMRLAGADASVYPNFGGRFSFTREECADIARATDERLGSLRPSFPAPGGGMTPSRIAEMLGVYGRNFILLIGAGLHTGGVDLAANARRVVELLGAV